MKYYAIRKGVKDNVIVNTWEECKELVHGVATEYKSFRSEDAAKAYLSGIKPSDYPIEGICCDGACSGNPGPSEARVTDLSGVQLLHQHLGEHTNNYAELVGVGMAVMYAKENNISNVYVDSRTALSWSKKAPVNQVKEMDMVTKMSNKISSVIQQSGIELIKWQTEKWGEIPADFGRK